MRRIKTHTVEKLVYFKKYIEAYLVATKRLPIKYYIDAFAGSGTCILCDKKCKSKGNLRCLRCGKGKLIDGSAMISLRTKNHFSGYLFADLNKNCINDLEKCIKKLDKSLQKKIVIEKSDANIILKKIYKYIPKYSGCLIFLDPEGSELKWETIKYLSKINKVDILMLYPYDMALVRLTKNYRGKLDKFYGSKDWIKIYKDKKYSNPDKRKQALLDFYIKNLKELGFKYFAYEQIRRKLRSGNPLYHLILVSHHPLAKKIMTNIFNIELDGQKKFKF